MFKKVLVSLVAIGLALSLMAGVGLASQKVELEVGGFTGITAWGMLNDTQDIGFGLGFNRGKFSMHLAFSVLTSGDVTFRLLGGHGAETLILGIGAEYENYTLNLRLDRKATSVAIGYIF